MISKVNREEFCRMWAVGVTVVAWRRMVLQLPVERERKAAQIIIVGTIPWYVPRVRKRNLWEKRNWRTKGPICHMVTRPRRLVRSAH